MNLLQVASKFNISQGIATGIVTTVLNAGTVLAVIGAVTVALSGGIDAILEVGWTAFIAEVKEQAARGTAGAATW
jgi:circularin A/uberolysin family circular bacteriocin